MTGNFVEKYLEMLNDEFLIEIQSKMRNKILKKYPKRVRKNTVEEDFPEIEDDEDEHVSEADLVTDRPEIV